MSNTQSGLESWRNVSPGTHFIKKMDHRGELSRDEGVQSGRTFHVSPEERRYNMETAADRSLDPFSNGHFEPVRLLDDSDEAREIANNPNIMSDTDMRKLVSGHHKTFENKLGGITNVVTLQRLLAIAREEEASVRRVEMIEAAIASHQPMKRLPGRDKWEPGTASQPAATPR